MTAFSRATPRATSFVAPPWGVGQRIFFLHDGRTSDLKQAILDHFSTSPEFPPPGDSTAGSEANQVINNFNALSVTDQQNLLNFLRAL